MDARYEIHLNDDDYATTYLESNYHFRIFEDHIECSHNQKSIPFDSTGITNLIIFVDSKILNATIHIFNYVTSIVSLDVLGWSEHIPKLEKVSCNGFKNLYINECKVFAIFSADAGKVHLRYVDVNTIYLFNPMTKVFLTNCSVWGMMNTGRVIEQLTLLDSTIKLIKIDTQTIYTLQMIGKSSIGRLYAYIHDYEAKVMNNIKQSSYMSTEINNFTDVSNISPKIIEYFLVESL